MQKYLPILDPGHGGAVNGVYYTPVNHGRFIEHGGETYMEGVFTRKVAAAAMQKFSEGDIAAVNIVTEPFDVTLSERVERYNAIARHLKGGYPYPRYPSKREEPELTPYLFSIHTNGGGGKGVECYTSPGDTGSDALATIALDVAKEWLSTEVAKYGVDMVVRSDWSDGDKDKEARFTVLKRTVGPAILFEYFFSDRVQEFAFLTHHKAADIIAEHIYRTHLAIERQL